MLDLYLYKTDMHEIKFFVKYFFFFICTDNEMRRIAVSKRKLNNIQSEEGFKRVAKFKAMIKNAGAKTEIKCNSEAV